MPVIRQPRPLRSKTFAKPIQPDRSTDRIQKRRARSIPAFLDSRILRHTSHPLICIHPRTTCIRLPQAHLGDPKSTDSMDGGSTHRSKEIFSRQCTTIRLPVQGLLGSVHLISRFHVLACARCMALKNRSHPRFWRAARSRATLLRVIQTTARLCVPLVRRYIPSLCCRQVPAGSLTLHLDPARFEDMGTSLPDWSAH